jgi:hypothetical protein
LIQLVGVTGFELATPTSLLAERTAVVGCGFNGLVQLDIRIASSQRRITRHRISCARCWLHRAYFGASCRRPQHLTKPPMAISPSRPVAASARLNECSRTAFAVVPRRGRDAPPSPSRRIARRHPSRRELYPHEVPLLPTSSSFAARARARRASAEYCRSIFADPVPARFEGVSRRRIHRDDCAASDRLRPAVLRSGLRPVEASSQLASRAFGKSRGRVILKPIRSPFYECAL